MRGDLGSTFDEDATGGITSGGIGRFGAVISGILGVMAFAGFFLGYVNWIVLPIGIVFILTGALAWRRAVASAREQAPRMGVEELRELVRHREAPFWVCTRCRSVMPETLGAGCLNCGSVAQCLQVADEDDRKIAVASVS